MNHLRIVPARPEPEKAIEAGGVDREFIGGIVRDFYSRVRADERLGPIFARHVAGDWEPHLEKMTDFWCSVILKTGTYHGRPVPAHLKLKEVRPTDFAIWLGLFRETVRQRCNPGIAAIFIERAERIAHSLQLAMFFRLPARPGTEGGKPDA
ncbi:group III truncated hemoglobin [Chelativorans intermedius]|uniref:Group III truncated hemoglobin n=1 Tax=Chelativorans intermedius TaxID=515947 RepID=A0ABV6D4I0_9HYPH|nr:group III truncated hemoglobin [Chelativorans intermedius]MCT8997557.1 group III truncated hemoglobin [Chelativorans intermedius]